MQVVVLAQALKGAFFAEDPFHGVASGHKVESCPLVGSVHHYNRVVGAVQAGYSSDYVQDHRDVLEVYGGLPWGCTLASVGDIPLDHLAAAAAAAASVFFPFHSAAAIHEPCQTPQILALAIPLDQAFAVYRAPHAVDSPWTGLVSYRSASAGLG